jgi:hypothetical protein
MTADVHTDGQDTEFTFRGRRIVAAFTKKPPTSTAQSPKTGRHNKDQCLRKAAETTQVYFYFLDIDRYSKD